jgi:hypothetical protein
MMRFLGRTITRFAPGLCGFFNKQSRTHFNSTAVARLSPLWTFAWALKFAAAAASLANQPDGTYHHRAVDRLSHVIDS